MFTEGQKIRIRPHTRHNPENESRPASFVRYMAGYEYAVLLVGDFDGVYNIRANVGDLDA